MIECWIAILIMILNRQRPQNLPQILVNQLFKINANSLKKNGYHAIDSSILSKTATRSTISKKQVYHMYAVD